MTAKEIIAYMESLQNEEQRRVLMGFFKTGPGEYGEGDEFLGLKVPQTREVFEKDVFSASKSIVISSPFLSSRKVEWLVSQSEMLQRKGITITVLSLSPEAYPEDGLEHHAELLKRLTSAGICVKTQSHCHERYAVIDQSLVWYGSMNILSRGREDDSLMRIVSPEIAAELLEMGVK